MIVEMRTYRIKAGERAKFAEVLRSKGFAELKRIGVKCAGPFLSVEDEKLLFWMRGFPDAAARETMTNQFYGGEAWRRELSDAFMPYLEKYDVIAVEMPESAVAWA